MTIGMAGGVCTAGEKGNRLHALQPSRHGWTPLCRVNSEFADGTPIEGRTAQDVTCKTCLRVLRKIARERRKP